MVKQNMIEKQAAAAAERSSDSCKYKGVRKRKWGKWVSEIRLPNSRERIWLGSYDSAKKAARAFDAALFCLRGRTAKFNFPDNPPEIAGGRSLTPAEIQVAAAKFANSDQPRIGSDHSSTEQCASELHAESPSTSVVSDATTVQLHGSSELALGGSFLELLNTGGSGNYAADYGIFPGFDDFHNDFFAPAEFSNVVDYGEENFDGVLGQDSFLWNF